MNDDLSWSTPRPITARPRQSCAVCGLRSDALVCAACAADPVSSIKWLEQLPQSERVKRALEELRRMG